MISVKLINKFFIDCSRLSIYTEQRHNVRLEEGFNMKIFAAENRYNGLTIDISSYH